LLLRLARPRSSLFPYTTLFRSVYDQEDVIHLTEDWLAALMVRNGINVVRRNMEPLSASTDGGVQLKEVPTVPPSVSSSASSTSRSEEHTSELQSRFDLVCRLLL